MLRFFSKFQRSRNAVLFLFSMLLLVGLVVFYIPNTPLTGDQRFAASGDDDQVVVKVGSQEIKLKEFRNMMTAVGQQYTGGRGTQLPFATLKALGVDTQSLDNLIANRLALDIGGDLNLAGTDREVSEQVVRTFINPETNQFLGKEEYLRRLALMGTNVNEYEQSLRDNLTATKVRSYLISGEQVSDKEIEESYKKDNTKVDVVYAIVDRDKVKDTFKPSDEELKAYYEAHKAEFKADEPTRKVEYIFISTDDVAKTMTITDADLREEYNSNKQYEYRASIIRRDVLATADESTVKDKIDEITKRVKPNTPDGKPEDFSLVAKAESQDTKTASKGGDIGWIRKDPNRTSAWPQRIYTSGLKVGDIDGPFRDGQSWYLMRVTEQREVPFEQMKATLRAGVANRKAYSQASIYANEAYEKATEYKDLRKAADEIALKLKTTADKLIRSTPYFKNGDTLPEIGSNPAFEEAVGALKKDEIGDKVGIPGGLAVPKVVDVLDKGTALSFEQARNQVENDLRKEKEPNIALAKAQELIANAKSAAEFQTLAKAAGFEVKTDTNFNSVSFPGQSQGGLQTSQQARNALFGLKEGEVVKAPIKFGAAGYIIFAATKRTEADLSKLPASREDIRQRLVAERQNMAFDAYIKAARKRYQDAGKIKIYQDRIDKFINAQSAQ
jgi:peptidyl-prolyl cis-trans isomerase D